LQLRRDDDRGGARVGDDPTRFVGFEDAGMRLDISLVHDLGGKSIFNNQIGAAKAIFDIAFFPRQLDKGIARRRKLTRQSRVVHDLRVKQRGGRQRFDGIEQRRALVILDLDEFQRLLGDG